MLRDIRTCIHLYMYILIYVYTYICIYFLSYLLGKIDTQDYAPRVHQVSFYAFLFHSCAGCMHLQVMDENRDLQHRGGSLGPPR